MGFRFRRRVRLLPGVHLNVTGRGVRSVSVGRRGATVNLSGRGARLTLGLPGTGLSYTTATVRPWWRPRSENAEHSTATSAAASAAAVVDAAEGGDGGATRAFARGFGRGLAGGGLVAGAVVTIWWLGAWALGALLRTAVGVVAAVRCRRPPRPAAAPR